MPRRTQVFQKVPWTGGVNTSVDPGVLPSNDLVQADNVVFTTAGTRKKREGFSYFDTELPAVISRSSSGTTRTLVFASDVDVASPVDQLIVVGEQLKVVGSAASYNTEAAIVASVSGATITYTFSGAASVTESSTADTAAVVTRNYDIIGVHDLWYFNATNHAKQQYRVALTSQGLLFRYDDNGRRKQIPMSGTGATAIAVTPVTACDLRTYNNKLVYAMSGLGNTPKVYDPMVADEWKDMPNAPDAEFFQEYLGRLFCNDKLDLDKMHFCTTFNEEEWQGLGDSGALFVGSGDGDNVGISAIMPPFKGRLFIGKGHKLAQMTGEDPETFVVEDMSTGIGAVAHKAALAVDLDDIYYLSRRGAHSIITTNQFGDFTGRYLSHKIQSTFNGWNQGRLKFTQGAYISTLNSAAWTVSEDGQTKASSLWLYNPTVVGDDGQQGEWFRWPNLFAQSLCSVLEDDEQRLLCGDNEGRLIISENGLYTDFDTDGIPFRVKSGTIYVDGNSQTIKAFKKLTLLFKPRGRFAFTAYFKVDNFPAQSLSFEQTVQGDKLGVDFILGQSLIGSNAVLAPFTKDVFGHGRGCTIEVFQSGVEAQVEIYGFMIEFESADIADEVKGE